MIFGGSLNRNKIIASKRTVSVWLNVIGIYLWFVAVFRCWFLLESISESQYDLVSVV